MRLFAMHGRSPLAVIDYDHLFRWMINLPAPETRMSISSSVDVAVEHAESQDSYITLRLINGHPDERPLIYDENTGRTAEGTVIDGGWIATATRAVVVPGRRLLSLESRRGGVTASNLERYIQVLTAERGYRSQVRLDLNPVPAQSFIDELNRFERVRVAEIAVRRPNFDWSDTSDQLSELAQESLAHEAWVAVKADRGQSISKNEGLMSIIKKGINKTLNMTNVRVTGRRAGDSSEYTLSLDRHQQRETTPLDTSLPQRDQDDTLYGAGLNLIAASDAVVGLANGEIEQNQ